MSQETMPPAESTATVTRIDGAHPTSAGAPQPAAEPIPAAILAAAAGRSPEQAAAQLQAQASQLARHLRERRQDIDQREAQLNARIAQLESELSASRLSLRECDQEYEEKEVALRQQIAELETRVQDLADELANDQQLRLKRQEVQQREADLAQRETRLAEEAESVRVAGERLRQQREQFEQQAAVARQQITCDRAAAVRQHHLLQGNIEQRRRTLDEQEQRIEQLADRCARGVELGEWEERLQGQQTQLDEAEALLGEHLAQLREDRAKWDQQRNAALEELAAQRRQLADEQRCFEQEMQAARKQLAARRREIEARAAAAEQLKEEATSAYGQTLEMRLIVEQVWSQVTDSASATQVTQSVSQLRSRLADQFVSQRQDLVRQRDQLHKLGSRLDAKRQRLGQQRGELEKWFARRQQEVEEQAARLVARELELDREHQRLREAENQWEDERQQLQARIRQLASQLRRNQPALS